jgi:ADP-ribose pyrophosphatase
MTEVVAAVIRNKNTILICRRPANKKRALLWEFVGGKPEPGETLPQALARECREELDIELEVGVEFAECTHAYPDMTVHLTAFEAKITNGEPKMLEHADMRWVTVDELDGYKFCPADAAILAKLKAGG